MISLKQLHYAVAVARHLHFKKAADDCAISQSALSTAISELEGQLGFQVFERNNKQVLVTPLGRRLLEKAREILIGVDELYRLADTNSAPLSVPLSLGIIPTVGPYLLPKVLPLVRQRHPDSQITIVEEQSAVLVEKVRSGELDTAILALPYGIEGLHAFEFWQEDFYLVAHQSDPLAQRRAVSGDLLKASGLLLLREGHCLKDHALAACHLSATEADRALSGTSLHTLVQMVAGRMGTTLVPALALDSLLRENTELRAIPLSDPGPHRRLAFITRLNYGGVADIDYLRGLFHSVLTSAQSA